MIFITAFTDDNQVFYASDRFLVTLVWNDRSELHYLIYIYFPFTRLSGVNSLSMADTLLGSNNLSLTDKRKDTVPVLCYNILYFCDSLFIMLYYLFVQTWEVCIVHTHTPYVPTKIKSDTDRLTIMQIDWFNICNN